MKLKNLLDVLPGCELRGDEDLEIQSIELDSRRVGGGELFVCLEGLARNGHDFAATAVAMGAVALVVRYPLPEVDATQVVVPDTREAMALLAAAFNSYPARTLTVVGVTGTNGKTTVTHLIQAVVETAGHRIDVLGTLGSKIGDQYQSTGFTTPEAPRLQELLRQAADRGTEWMAMEVSSHALAQKRTYATDFAAVVFTNLSRDHLDYHRTMEEYFEAKKGLFTREGRGSKQEPVAVINLEDPAGVRLAGLKSERTTTYGFSGDADYCARNLRTDSRGSRYELVTPGGSAKVDLDLLGRFNVLNAVAAQATAIELGVPLETAARGVKTVTRVPGRMEPVTGSQAFLVLVDFAHSPDALSQALKAAREMTSNKLAVVFGCGGERDPGKRPEMGKVAVGGADRVVVTSDNPRGENPEAIINDILAGTRESRVPVQSEVDRSRAIRLALEEADSGDTVLITGKGHETVQLIRGESVPFDDRSVAKDVLRENGFDVDD